MIRTQISLEQNAGMISLDQSLADLVRRGLVDLREARGRARAPNELESLLREVDGVRAETVFADRMVGKPYIEIDINREAIGRYGLTIGRVQDVIQVALGGQMLTRTVEGRERYPVRARYMREERDSVEALGRVLVSAPAGEQIPLEQLAEIAVNAAAVARTFDDLSERFGFKVDESEAAGFAGSIGVWPPFADSASALAELDPGGLEVLEALQQEEDAESDEDRALDRRRVQPRGRRRRRP